MYHTHPAGARDYFLFVYDDEPAAGDTPCRVLSAEWPCDAMRPNMRQRAMTDEWWVLDDETRHAGGSGKVRRIPCRSAIVA